MAPELFSRSNDLSYLAADIWALGVMTFFILTKRSLFKTQRDLFQYERRPEDFFPYEELNNCQISEKGQAFVRDLMRPDPEVRPDSNAASHHVWVQPWIPTELIIPDTRSQ